MLILFLERSCKMKRKLLLELYLRQHVLSHNEFLNILLMKIMTSSQRHLVIQLWEYIKLSCNIYSIIQFTK